MKKADKPVVYPAAVEQICREKQDKKPDLQSGFCPAGRSRGELYGRTESAA